MKFCPWTNVGWTNVAWRDDAWTNVAWTNVARTGVVWTTVSLTNVARSNGIGPLVTSQGWFHKLEMSSWGGWGEVEINANSVQLCQS